MDSLKEIYIREAKIEDINQIQKVRNSVVENTLSDPTLVTDKDCEEYLTIKGKGWVCEVNSQIVGFSIIDLIGNNVWALFLNPENEGRGLGRKLHDIMLDWYFSKTRDSVWLGTAKNTRAEYFYRHAGWIEIGVHGNDEIKFEMTFDNWTNRDKSNAIHE